MIEPELGTASESFEMTSLGDVLRTAREGKQFSLEEVALRLNIPLKHLESLENEAYDQLPGMPFAKGYLRSYAKVLGLNADGLIAQLVDEAASQADSRVASINKVGQQVHVGHPIMRISLIFFVFALLGVSFWWWQTQSSMNISELSQPVESVPVTGGEAAALTPKNTEADPTDIQARLAAKRQEMENLEQAFSELNAPSGTENTEGGQTEETAETTEDEPVYLSATEIAQLASDLKKPEETLEESATAAETSAVETNSVDINTSEDVTTDTAAFQGVLEIQFSGDCWVSIRDASDKLVFANTKRGGETLTLSLDLPASVLIGKVSSVGQARFNGELLDLAAEAKKDVAKITLAAN